MMPKPNLPKFLRPLVLASVLMLILGALPGWAFADDGADHVYIYAITDFHGHVEQGGKVAGMLDEVRAEHEADGVKRVVFASAGDNVNASYFVSSIANDAPAMEQLTAMGLDVSAVGNHEFDKGVVDFNTRIAQGLSQTHYVLSNLTGSDLTGAEPYYVMEVNGKRVAFVGGLTEGITGAVNPSMLGNLQLTKAGLVKTINDYADALSDGSEANGEADAVVALVHEGAEFLKGLDGNVDAVVAGHTHIVDTQTTDAGAPIVQAGHYGDAYGLVDLDWEGDAVRASGSAQAIPDDTPEDGRAREIFEEAQAEAETLGQEQVGTLADDATGRLSTFNRGACDPTLHRASSSDDSSNYENRGTESTLGDLVAEATLWSVRQGLGEDAADIGIVNAGGLRADLDPDGDGRITYMEAYNVLPFGNTNAIVTLTGAQLKEALEEQWTVGLTGSDAWKNVRWLGLSHNVTYAYSVYTDEATGDEAATVFDLKVDGKPVEDTDTYRVCGNAFQLSGGDDKAVFTEGTDYVDTGLVDLDGFVDYLRAQGEAGVRSGLRRQSAGFENLSVSDTNVVSFDISGLSFTTVEPRPTYVHVAANGVDFGYFPVADTGNVADRAGLANKPHTGQAHVTKVLSDEELATFGGRDASIREADVRADEALRIDDPTSTYVNFDELPDASKRFPDVDYTSWYASGTCFCGSEGLITGYEDGRFGVGDTLTRAQLATILWRNAEPEEAATYDASGTENTTGMSDVAAHAYYTAAANWAVETGAIRGYGNEDGTHSFGPDDPVTTEQLLTVLARYVDPEEALSSGGSVLAWFSDADQVSDYAREAVAQLWETGIVSGYAMEDGAHELRPQEQVSRERTATFLMRCFERGVLGRGLAPNA